MTNKFTVKMKPRRTLHEKTQRFLRGRWRTEAGVYINKEQRFPFLELANMIDATQDLGWGWGGVG